MNNIEKLNKILEYKEDIRDAIIGKGGALTEATPLKDYADAIDDISSGLSGVSILEGGTGTISDAEYSKVTKLAPYVFYNNLSITNGSFPLCSVVGEYAFAFCTSLATLSFPVCQTIKSRAFGNCSLVTKGYFPNCTSIENYAFWDCPSMTACEIPKCQGIEQNTFYGCEDLSKINIPEVSYIKKSAFYNCESLKEVHLDKCTSIASSVFYRCYALKSVYLLGSSLCNLEASGAFGSTPLVTYTGTGASGSIFVRASLLEDYKTATNWTYLSSRFVGLTDAEIEAL